VAAVAYGPWKGPDPGRPSLTLAEKGAIESIETQYADSAGVLWRIRAPFYPGNGGGALVSLSGEWIGLISGAVAGEIRPAADPFGRDPCAGQSVPREAGVIVPAEFVARAVREMEACTTPGQGFLGVSTSRRSAASDRGVSPPHGVVVSEVLPESPAARYGIHPGDQIVRFDGQPVESLSQLTDLVRQTTPGQLVRIEFIRGGQARRLQVCMGDSDAADLFLLRRRQETSERLRLQRDIHRLEREAELLRRRLSQLAGSRTAASSTAVRSSSGGR
jgi:S1-C subfamily serine protease